MLQTEAGRVATEVSSRLVDERETFNLLNRTQFGAWWTKGRPSTC